MSAARSRRRRWSSWYLQTILAWYVLAVALLPLGHHDLACHLKSSTHCTSCVVGSVAGLTSAVSSLNHLAVDDAGRAMRHAGPDVVSVSAPAFAGRAPPAL
jgi:hypothetical protein